MEIFSLRWKLPTAVAVALLATSLCAALAPAATSPEQTRESYLTRVEPICKKNTEASEKILAGVESEIRKDKLAVPARRFKRASAAFGRAVRQLRAVPQPPSDEAKLNKWLKLLGKEKALLGRIGTALKKGRKSQVPKLSVKLTRNGNLANSTVLGFDFDYCLIDSSRFR